MLAPDPVLFSQQEERALYDLFEAKKGEFMTRLQERRYPEAIGVLVGFKETVDRLFRQGLRHGRRRGLKNNHLSLLTKIKDMFLQYGDFSRIRVEELA